MAEKSSLGTRQTDGKKLVWFEKIERKLAKLSMPTFTYRSSSYYFMVPGGKELACRLLCKIPAMGSLLNQRSQGY
jgi:hypothetical protein